MKRLLMRVTLAVSATAILGAAPALAQSPGQPVAYSGGAGQSYAFPAPTPEDAYRDGTINRWELERLTGPLPQALQGPSVNGNRGSGGGDKGG